MTASDDQLIDLLRQHCPVRRVVVAATADRVGEMSPGHHIVFGHDIVAFQEPGLADAGLRGEIDDIGIFKARHFFTREIQQTGDAGAAFQLRLGQILHLEATQFRHMRAVEPDNAGQRRLQPPEGPAPADQALGLMIDQLEGLRVLTLEPLGCVGINAAPAGNRRQDKVGFDMRSAGAGGNIEITRCIDDDITEDCLHACLGLADHAPDRLAFNDRGREPAMGSEFDARQTQNVISGTFEGVGIESGRKADRMRHGLRVKIEESPARPALPGIRRIAELDQTVAVRRRDAQTPELHALDHFHADAAHGNLELVDHIVEHQHHAAGGEAADIRIALQQGHARAIARRRHCRRDPGRAAADHHDVGTIDHFDVARRLMDCLNHCRFLLVARAQCDPAGFQRTTFASTTETRAKRTTARRAAITTVA